MHKHTLVCCLPMPGPRAAEKPEISLGKKRGNIPFASLFFDALVFVRMELKINWPRADELCNSIFCLWPPPPQKKRNGEKIPSKILLWKRREWKWDMANDSCPK